jgi:dolichol-phosphate hexosyltransferase
VYKGQSITAIIPCLNEEKAIGHVLREIPDFVDEVIVVDNNSTDRTPDVAREYRAKVVHEPVAGYGRAYKRGFSVATGDIIVTLDGDHTYPVSGISYLLEAFLHLQVDFLSASRFPVRDPEGMSFKHKIGNVILSAAMSMLFFKWVRDSQSGMSWRFPKRSRSRRCGVRGRASGRSRSFTAPVSGRPN